jgi:hypothetical protein
MEKHKRSPILGWQTDGSTHIKWAHNAYHTIGRKHREGTCTFNL